MNTRSRVFSAALGAALTLTSIAPLAQVAPPLPPTFRFAPKAVGAGGVITVSGERFTGPVLIVAVHPNGTFTLLGTPALSSGAFTTTVTAPPIAGPYFMVVQDGPTRRVAINLIGTLAVVPPGSPWFAFGPTTVAPGGTVSVLAGSFTPGTVAAAFGTLEGGGGARVLGVMPLSPAGGGQASFTAAATVPGGYPAFLKSSGNQVAANLTGPLTITTTPPPPEVGVGFYPIGAAANAAGRVWVPNAGDNTVSVIDNGAVSVTVPVGALPCAITRSSLSGRVFVAGVNTEDVTVIDEVTSDVISSIPVGQFPCAAASVGGRVFIGNYGSDTVSVIDEATLSVIDTIPSGNGPFGMAANQVTGRVYVANGYDNTLSVVDASTLATLAIIPVGRDPDAVGVNPLTNRVYVGNYLSGTTTVIDGATNTVIATVIVGREPSAVAVNPATGHVFVANYASNTVSVIDGASNSVVATIPVGITPDGLAIDGAGRVYVVNSNSNSVSIIDDVAGVVQRSSQP
jgi:YVTN family beta-propeller protein